MKLIIGKRISILFIVALSALALMAWLSSYNNKRFLESSAIIVRENAIQFQSEQFKSVLVDIETGQRGFIITGDSLFLGPYTKALDAIDENIVRLSALLDTTAKNRKRMQRLHSLIERKNEFAMQAIAARNVDFQASRSFILSGEGNDIMEEVRTIVNEIQFEAQTIVQSQHATREAAMNRFNVIFIAVMIASVVLLAMSFVMLNRNLAIRIRGEERVLQLNTELEAFSYSVSHDLRSPLRVIDGYAGILKEDYVGKLDDEGQKVVDVIVGNVRKMGQLIDDLLDFSHMSRKPVMKSLLDFSETVTRISDENKVRFNLDKLDVKLKPLEPVFADLKMMEQVWVNLISNAMKYSSKNAHPCIEIGSFRQNADVCFYVRDNGVGFNMDYKDKLFGVFQRLHKPEEFPGTGVGLAIVKRIVSRHGGNVWAEGRVNEGATFYFSIPT
jgi:signal transduction histidine kinase